MKKETKGEGNVNKKIVVMAVAVLLLLVFSAVQAIELTNLKNMLNNELTTLSVAGKTEISTSSSSTGLQQNIQNLPSMVGGC